ncbi:FadR/GntR family transcriptional regulator [Arthrobacter nitrophenolicus]|uniref:FadR family transcriptional regulator n=1 Tax=Arthrobacter nitrophenolicus TaxID=683150 RepID=A0A4R5XQX8_9MICC|nr:FCD domain-containing protein [Arthrobacter nitrophenolicus]TDL33973.1 FadR family transcriptional regulator [Arthrobacter nitrophenolicus]
MTQNSGAVQPAVQDSGTPRNAAASGLNLAAPRSRAEHLAAALEERVRAQGLEPGALVGTLPSLREETGYARATVSEAVRLLRERGVLEIRPGRTGGLFVAETSPVVRLRHTLLTVGEQPSAVMDAIELRDHLEELIDVGAARCRTDADLAELRLLVGNMESSTDWDGLMRANWALHERIAAICPNAMARAVYIGTLGHLASSASSRFDEDEAAAAAYRADRLRVHAELVEAIASGDIATVRQAVTNHNH